MSLPPLDLPESEIIKVIRRQQMAIAAEEEAQMILMADRWLQIERRLEAQISALAFEIAEKQAAGAAVTMHDLVMMERYQALLVQAQAEFERYAAWSNQVISGKQGDLLRMGIENGIDAITWSYKGVGIEMVPNFNRLPVGALDAVIGFAGDGSPLVTLLQDVYPDAVQGLTDALLNAVLLGKNPREAARMMRDGMGMGLERALTIARTEQMRAYRFSSQEQYRNSNVTQGYKRVASRQPTVCAGCLFSDGQFFLLAVDFEDHPNGKCQMVPVVIGVDAPTWSSSFNWFENQPEDVQRGILGPGRFNAWQNGVSLESMVTRKVDPVWGGMYVPTPVGALVNE